MSTEYIVPPEYEAQECSSSPVYSLVPSSSEIVLQQCALSDSPPASPTVPSQCPINSWIYTTKHMKINLGPRIWATLDHPSYGLNGNITGSVGFLGKIDCVDKVTLTLEGHLTTSIPQRPGTYDSCFLSRTLTIYESNGPGPMPSEPTFSLSIPPETCFEGLANPTPPSFFCYHYAATCEIAYSLKVCMYRKGTALGRRQESKSITILYLPKSTPANPPLSRIPRPSRIESEGVSPLYLHMFDRVDTAPLIPFWPNYVKGMGDLQLDPYFNCVNVSIPTPKCFSSGEHIPYTCSLVFPSQPCLSKLLTRSVRVVLYKRVLLYSHTRKKGIFSLPLQLHDDEEETSELYREWPIATGKLKFQNEYSEGMMLVRGSIEAGGVGQECSWKLGDVAEVQFILRASLTPPKCLQSNVPSFKRDFVVDITTDTWGSLDRELSATGGMPTPALGLMSSNVGSDYLGPWCYAGL